MIVIALCAVLVVAITTLAIGTHRSRQHPGSHRETEHEGWTSAEEIRELGDAPPTPHPAAWEPVMAAPVDGHPPWDTAPVILKTAQNLTEADVAAFAERFRAALQREKGQPCASGNGHVTDAEPLAPLPPEPKPEPPAAAAPAIPACTGPSARDSAATPDALTLLDERQQLIDHAAAVIAAAKFDRILGAVMAG